MKSSSNAGSASSLKMTPTQESVSGIPKPTVDLLPSTSHLRIRISVSLFCDVGNVVVQPTGRQGIAHGEHSIHSVACFVDLIVLVAPGVVLTHAHNEVEDRHYGPDGVGVAAEHHVAEGYVVVRRDVACRYTGER